VTDEIKGGLLWYPGDSDSDSLNPALNAAMLLTRYAQIATTQDKAKRYLVRPPITSFHFHFPNHVATFFRTFPNPNSITH
jgi:endoglucanase